MLANMFQWLHEPAIRPQQIRGLSQDGFRKRCLSPNHVDEAFMAKTSYGKRIAHGALLVGYMSGSSTDIVGECKELQGVYHPVSLGYDRIRFLKPVFIGDTIAMHYVITAVDDAKGRTMAEIDITNQNGELCAVATHIMKWLKLN
jgi:3-hydroxybutyryl-CoA dehydratase